MADGLLRCYCVNTCLLLCLYAFREGLHSKSLVFKRSAPPATYCYGADCQLHKAHEICLIHYRLSMPCYMSNHRHCSTQSISLLFISNVIKVVGFSQCDTVDLFEYLTWGNTKLFNINFRSVFMSFELM